MKAVVRTVPRPDLAREGVGVVKASTWRVGSPERQRATLDAIARAWESRDWPAVGLLSYSVHVGTDGDTLFHYSQWTDEGAYQEFVRAFRDERNAEIDAAVPGIERVGLHSYERYRSLSTGGDGAVRVPGCVVVVEAEFDGAGTARAWVDLVIEALATDPALPAGGLSGTFHLGTDGARMLNYAEWTSEEAHIEALASPGAGIGSDTEAWAAVQAHAGMTTNRFRRYLPGLTLVPAPADR
ncbi:antibiotic biosynthesis monooxygenase [Streptomyces antimicrobicus]|uniref:Antibiotic biosynthesis monooxygenase n=1 Tax=Streptomyces antimicrobicus TaxID=2883108 RepID=A0ABS8BE95_9ACTN|nr:antibiotic biosynthesis monooxygenase [Streptomyces antimicrobicus]MCB5182940.1 antibiotic biosynthesis monooxygenase [Streptomyces antimicrobicus]